MSRPNVSALCAILLSGCATPETVGQPPGPPVNWSALDVQPDVRTNKVIDKERQAADLYFKALAQPGLSDLGDVLDELVYFECGAVEARGRDRAVAAHQEVLGAFEQRNFMVKRAWVTNDDKAIEWLMTATREGRPVRLAGLTLLSTNDDALISDVHVYVAGPGTPREEERHVFEPEVSPRETRNVALTRAFIHALESNQDADFLARVTGDAQGFALDSGPADLGKEAARKYFGTIRKSLGELDVVIENVFGVQDFVVVEYSLSGRQLAPLRRLPVITGGIVRLRIVDVVKVENDQIARIWRYESPGALRNEAEVTP